VGVKYETGEAESPDLSCRAPAAVANEAVMT
jgi:hypothetical protein